MIIQVKNEPDDLSVESGKLNLLEHDGGGITEEEDLTDESDEEDHHNHPHSSKVQLTDERNLDVEKICSEKL